MSNDILDVISWWCDEHQRFESANQGIREQTEAHIAAHPDVLGAIFETKSHADAPPIQPLA